RGELDADAEKTAQLLPDRGHRGRSRLNADSNDAPVARLRQEPGDLGDGETSQLGDVRLTVIPEVVEVCDEPHHLDVATAGARALLGRRTTSHPSALDQLSFAAGHAPPLGGRCGQRPATLPFEAAGSISAAMRSANIVRKGLQDGGQGPGREG